MHRWQRRVVSKWNKEPPASTPSKTPSPHTHTRPAPSRITHTRQYTLHTPDTSQTSFPLSCASRPRPRAQPATHAHRGCAPALGHAPASRATPEQPCADTRTCAATCAPTGTLRPPPTSNCTAAAPSPHDSRITSCLDLLEALARRLLVGEGAARVLVVRAHLLRGCA